MGQLAKVESRAWPDGVYACVKQAFKSVSSLDSGYSTSITVQVKLVMSLLRDLRVLRGIEGCAGEKAIYPCLIWRLREKL